MSGQPGELIECSDEAIRQYILDMNKKNREQAESKVFVLRDLPPRHLFVKKGSTAFLRKAINELIDNNTFRAESE